jgi:hypothetical protein
MLIAPRLRPISLPARRTRSASRVVAEGPTSPFYGICSVYRTQLSSPLASSRPASHSKDLSARSFPQWPESGLLIPPRDNDPDISAFPIATTLIDPVCRSPARLTALAEPAGFRRRRNTSVIFGLRPVQSTVIAPNTVGPEPSNYESSDLDYLTLENRCGCRWCCRNCCHVQTVP